MSSMRTRSLAVTAAALVSFVPLTFTLGCNKPVYPEDYARLGTAPGFCHHCHTGKCPVGITTQIELSPDENVVDYVAAPDEEKS